MIDYYPRKTKENFAESNPKVIIKHKRKISEIKYKKIAEKMNTTKNEVS